jgi:hypothetical protein
LSDGDNGHPFLCCQVRIDPLDSTAIQRSEDLPPKGQRAPQPPAGLRSRYFVRDNRIVIETPFVREPGCLASWVLLVLALIGLLVYLLVDKESLWGTVIIWGILGGVVAVGYRMVWPEQTIFKVDPEGLYLRKRGLLFRGSLFDWRREIPAREIQDVIRRGLGLVILTAHGKVDLDLPVELPDVEWIHAILRRVLAC